MSRAWRFGTRAKPREMSNLQQERENNNNKVNAPLAWGFLFLFYNEAMLHQTPSNFRLEFCIFFLVVCSKKA